MVSIGMINQMSVPQPPVDDWLPFQVLVLEILFRKFLHLVPNKKHPCISSESVNHLQSRARPLATGRLCSWRHHVVPRRVLRENTISRLRANFEEPIPRWNPCWLLELLRLVLHGIDVQSYLHGRIYGHSWLRANQSLRRRRHVRRLVGWSGGNQLPKELLSFSKAWLGGNLVLWLHRWEKSEYGHHHWR